MYFWEVAFYFASRNFFYLVLFHLRKQIKHTTIILIWTMIHFKSEFLASRWFFFFLTGIHSVSVANKKKLHPKAIFMLYKDIAFRSIPQKPIHVTFYLHTWSSVTDHTHDSEVLLHWILSRSSDNSQLCRKLPKDMFSSSHIYSSLP